MADMIDWKILEDGTIVLSTGKVGAANHMSAERLLQETAMMSGGNTERKAKSKDAHHHHGHGHDHGDHDHVHA